MSAPAMNHNAILRAVYARVQAVPEGAGLLPIKYEGKTFSHGGKPYAELLVVPLKTETETVDGGDAMAGFIQVNVYVQDDAGAEYPAEEAQKFLDVFPKWLEFAGMRVPRTGTIHRPVDKKDGWHYTPTIIDYEADA